jgi:hypothetical protein
MPDTNRRIAAEINAGQYMRRLREESPRLLVAYGTSRKVAAHLGISRSDAQDLILLELCEAVRRKTLQRRRMGSRAVR